MQKTGIRGAVERLRRLGSGSLRRLKGAAAIVTAGATLLAGVPAAFAGGGGGSSDGGGGGVMATQVSWAYQDNNDGAFGSGGDLNSIYNAFAQMGVTMLPGGVAHAQEALAEAQTNCFTRFNEAHPDQMNQGQCRVVAVGVMTGPNKQFSGEVHHSKDDWMAAWANTVVGKTFSNHGTTYGTGDPFADQPGTSVNSLVDQYTSDSTSTVVIVLNQYEPRPANYRLSLSTHQQGGGPVSGGTNPISDGVVADTNGSPIREDVTGTVTLNWYGYPTDTSWVHASASKTGVIHNYGSSSFPEFTPADLGMESWPAGRLGWVVDIPQQGRMDGPVHHDDNQPNESWSSTPPAPHKELWDAEDRNPVTPQQVVANSVPYVSRVSANTAGGDLWLYDTLLQDVWIGAADHDDMSRVSVTDAAGAPVGAQVEIDRSTPGKVIVKAHVLDWHPRDIVLHVPVYPLATGHAGTLKDDSKACWSGDGGTCQTGDHKEIQKVVPKPDKVWVVDEAGALVASDPGHTNAKGKDNRVWVPGDPISAVVNGRIPAHLTGRMDGYTIVDDWTGAARYVDFTDASKAKVFVDGTDRTSEFDISVRGTKTFAKAKASFLRGTANLPADLPVKLVISGVVKDAEVPEAATITNAGVEQWSNEGNATNVPSAFVRSPNPDKVWARDTAEALASNDPARTNDKGADNLVFLTGDKVDAVVNGRIPKGLATDLTRYVITDDWTGAAQHVDFSDASKARVYVDGTDRTSGFDIRTDGTTTVATAKASTLRGTENLAADKAVKLVIEGRFKDGTRTNGRLVRLTNTGSEQWNGKKVRTNTPPVYVWTPNPDKAWVMLENGDPMSGSQDYKLVIDPEKTNRVGADGKSLRLGDRVAAAVNGTVPAGLALAPKIVLKDDWAKVDRILDPEALSHVRVYDKGVASADKSSVAAIDSAGRDVTDQFEIRTDGTTTTATAKPAYSAGLKQAGQARQITMLVPFKVNFDPAALRQEYGKGEGDALDACANPDGSRLDNTGAQGAGTSTVDTNKPGLCVTVPPIHKDVVAEASQGGAQESVDGKKVMPGQKIEYTIMSDPQIPADDAYEITTVAVTDKYDPATVADKQTLEVTDLNTGRIIPRSQWSAAWDDTAHKVVLTFGRDWVRANWTRGSHPRILARFEARVRQDARPDHIIDNQAWLTVNNGSVPSNTVTNQPPTITPGKQVTQRQPSINIDGKTALLGDRLYYRIGLSAAGLTDMAYKVQRLGVVDDYDEEYLKPDTGAIQVIDSATGVDVTGKLNIQVTVRDGVAYAFFKTVDTPITATGETVRGDPQPRDLKAYSTKALDPLHDPYIDQSVLGHDYQVVLPMTVIKVTDGHVVRNKATQVTNDRRDVTNQVSNPVHPINPGKDVVVKVGGQSVDTKDIYLNSLFLYQLDSSVLPANRAYPQVSLWRIDDQLDPTVDRYTGQWAVYAARDLVRGGRVLAARGDRIAGQGFDSSPFGGDLFTLTQDPSGKVTILATQVYKDLAAASGDREMGWRAFIQCERIAVVKHHENKFTETYNGQTNTSNTVWTSTPDTVPRLRIVKFDTKSGLPDGDRNDPKDALEIHEDTDITFRVYNESGVDPATGNGHVFLGKDIKLEDATVAGDGKVEDLKYPDGWDTYVLKPGKYVDIHGTLKGVTDHHTDRAKVTGKPLAPCRPAEDTSPFDPARPSGRAATAPAAGGSGATAGTSGGGSTAPTAGGTSQRRDEVTVEGVAMCAGPTVESNQDDWNGALPPKPEPLAITGSAVTWMLVAGLALLSAGLLLIRAIRRDAQGRAYLYATVAQPALAHALGEDQADHDGRQDDQPR